MMKVVAEQIAQWYMDNVNAKELDKKIEATLDYVKRFNQPDESGDWNVWAYEMVDGHHGQYTVRIFLDSVLGTGDKYMEEEDLDEVMEAFDSVSTVLAQLFNDHSELSGNFWIGHNEADGSLGVTYSVKE